MHFVYNVFFSSDASKYGVAHAVGQNCFIDITRKISANGETAL